MQKVHTPHTTHRLTRHPSSRPLIGWCGLKIHAEASTLLRLMGRSAVDHIISKFVAPVSLPTPIGTWKAMKELAYRRVAGGGGGCGGGGTLYLLWHCNKHRHYERRNNRFYYIVRRQTTVIEARDKKVRNEAPSCFKFSPDAGRFIFGTRVHEENQRWRCCFNEKNASTTELGEKLRFYAPS